MPPLPGGLVPWCRADGLVPWCPAGGLVVVPGGWAGAGGGAAWQVGLVWCCLADRLVGCADPGVWHTDGHPMQELPRRTAGAVCTPGTRTAAADHAPQCSSLRADLGPPGDLRSGLAPRLSADGSALG
ncbi:hypothetical protein GCM10025867_21020 [Frondihabitans sucicola]|uniref:Uncharacterized protein n=1 Tax=Frondihabitans sucicola TaxID=1268041 RepID=A0ABM8GN43_9MICO|nr:hypothetical protein GCM10025867_21020 [Frondihabitans sucicola]